MNTNTNVNPITTSIPVQSSHIPNLILLPNVKSDSVTNATSQINLSSLSDSLNSTKLNIIPVDTIEKKELAEEHTSEPFRNLSDINAVVKYFLNNQQYRNAMLFIAGICTGLRCSDLRELKFSDIINSDCTFKNELVVFEKKTRHTRKLAKNRHIGINNTLKKIISLYLTHTPNVLLTDYMFTSESNNGARLNKPISRQAIDKMLKDTCKILNIKIKIGTHSLRKTFGRLYMSQYKNDPMAIYKLQVIFGHSSPIITTRYIGIESEEIKLVYEDLDMNIDNLLDNY